MTCPACGAPLGLHTELCPRACLACLLEKLLRLPHRAGCAAKETKDERPANDRPAPAPGR